MLAIYTALFSFSLNISFYFKIPVYLCSLYIMSISINLASAYKSKVRSIYLLIRKNRNKIKLTSFKEYMQAPCGRQIVKIVLSKTNKKEYYKLLKREYPMHFLKFSNTKTRIVFYRENNEEILM
ncbi:hypothetical protein [Leptospira biflexa]|uniref:hypothetical protein n=1 Tax=Leptospira biflexa TaxID=172 RepID=UPI001FED5428|nr:hypothetical protein [Leptospira biflexa]